MQSNFRNQARTALASYRKLKARLLFRFPYPTADLYSWRPKTGGVNFGDELGRIVTTLMLARRGMTLEDETKKPSQLLTIGSVMHFAREGAVVWGSGVNGKARSDIYEFQNLDVRACRGPMTKAWLEKRGISAPAVFGDPALLLPILTQGRFSVTKNSQKIVFVPNLFDDLEQLDIPSNVAIVKPTQSWNHVVAQILEARFVVSSSLHGIIVAEAFGIPAQFIAVSKEENEFKYKDYYEGTGRNQFTAARTIEEAIDLAGEDLLDFDPRPLMEAFPYDLWKS